MMHRVLRVHGDLPAAELAVTYMSGCNAELCVYV
jgi:hypothetical protein